MKSQKKISRRDAIKLLGAVAGATALANLPSKWSKPELVSGVVPAHAQTSSCGPLTFTSCSGNVITASTSGNYTPSVTISSPLDNIELDLGISSSGGPVSITPNIVGTYLTVGGSVSAPQITYNFLSFNVTTIYIRWYFRNSADGCDVHEDTIFYDSD